MTDARAALRRPSSTVALEEDELQHINVDIPTAVKTIVGALSAVGELGQQMADELPRFELSGRSSAGKATEAVKQQATPAV